MRRIGKGYRKKAAAIYTQDRLLQKDTTISFGVLLVCGKAADLYVPKCNSPRFKLVILCLISYPRDFLVSSFYCNHLKDTCFSLGPSGRARQSGEQRRLISSAYSSFFSPSFCCLSRKSFCAATCPFKALSVLLCFPWLDLN